MRRSSWHAALKDALSNLPGPGLTLSSFTVNIIAAGYEITVLVFTILLRNKKQL